MASSLSRMTATHTSQILEMWLYIQNRAIGVGLSDDGGDDSKRLHLADGEVISRSKHDKLHQIGGAPDVGAILYEEFKSRKGKMIVSGKFSLPYQARA
jgi:hypothetical protein